MTRLSPITISWVVPAGAVAGKMRAFGMITARKHEGERPQAKPPPPARKPRKPTLTSVAKAASKAAIPVARYEIKPDGTVVVVTGEPAAESPGNEVDEWIAKHADKTQRH